MEEYTLTGSLFESTEKIKVYKVNWDNPDISKAEIIYEWLSNDIIDILREEDSFKEVSYFGFKIHHVKCEINPLYNRSKNWKIIYSVYRNSFMGGGTYDIEDLDIKIRDIKLKRIL
jgi:hypothetical protein